MADFRVLVRRAEDSITVSSGSNSFEIADIAGVPEPAAWAMMLLGFAGLGAGIRGVSGGPATAYETSVLRTSIEAWGCPRRSAGPWNDARCDVLS